MTVVLCRTLLCAIHMFMGWRGAVLIELTRRQEGALGEKD
jgi:hypothetical protein